MEILVRLGINYFPSLRIQVYPYSLTNLTNTTLPTHKLGIKYWLNDQPPITVEDFDSLDEVNDYVNKYLLH
jgi:hypothetical protein